MTAEEARERVGEIRDGLRRAMRAVCRPEPDWDAAAAALLDVSADANDLAALSEREDKEIDMVTDEERRRVAERLRMADDRDAESFDCLLAEAVMGHSYCETPCESCHRRVLGELADLIDPDCDEGCYEGVHTARSVDRKALLALADELDDCGLDGWACGPLDVGGFARRIREACGEGTS